MTPPFRCLRCMRQSQFVKKGEGVHRISLEERSSRWHSCTIQSTSPG
jgi:hypothetical protein